jgi:hypothetical protein
MMMYKTYNKPLPRNNLLRIQCIILYDKIHVRIVNPIPPEVFFVMQRRYTVACGVCNVPNKTMKLSRIAMILLCEEIVIAYELTMY